jgi:endonuclease/exonuclease/phosphatase family metal-dependent hydrolase
VTVIVTWNIQNGKGCDGATDLSRIGAALRKSGEADVICLQEIARRDPAIAAGADQVAELQALFPGYVAIFGAALARNERQYGNLLLSRLPLLQFFNHLLPYPAAGGTKHMQRQAIEAVVGTRAGPLRVMSTHLEYYSAAQRAAQIERLRALQGEVADHASRPAQSGASPYDAVPRPAALVLCGDLNFLPQDRDYAQLFQPPLIDAWRHARKSEPHPPTTGVHDRAQWPRGGHCRDYFAVTSDVAARIAAVDVDLATDASDHQPLRLALRD